MAWRNRSDLDAVGELDGVHHKDALYAHHVLKRADGAYDKLLVDLHALAEHFFGTLHIVSRCSLGKPHGACLHVAFALQYLHHF